MANYLTVATFLQQQQAYFAKAKLESEGIEVFLKDELMGYLLATGGTTLQVEEHKAEQAMKILTECGYI